MILGEMVEEQLKRLTARKLWIKDLLAGTYVKEEGMKPNHIALSDGSQASRVNIVGVVVITGSEGMPTLVLDDGSGRITVRTFEPSERLSKLQVGDPVLIVGRPREFNNEKYILPEIVRKIDVSWFEVRKLELNASPIAHQPEPVPIVNEEPVEDAFILTENVLGIIRSLDGGQGADTDSVINQLNVLDAEKTIRLLLQSGDIFEVSPGKIKVLE